MYGDTRFGQSLSRRDLIAPRPFLVELESVLVFKSHEDAERRGRVYCMAEHAREEYANADAESSGKLSQWLVFCCTRLRFQSSYWHLHCCGRMRKDYCLQNCFVELAFRLTTHVHRLSIAWHARFLVLRLSVNCQDHRACLCQAIVLEPNSRQQRCARFF
jgi:hypothetical protein